MRETIPEGFERCKYQVFCKTCRRAAKKVTMCFSVTYHCPHCEEALPPRTPGKLGAIEELNRELLNRKLQLLPEDFDQPEQREQDEDTQPMYQWYLGPKPAWDFLK